MSVPHSAATSVGSVIAAAVAGLVAMVAATIVEPRPGAPDFDVPIGGELVAAGDLGIRLHDAMVLDLDESRIRVRALGLEPRVEVAWRGSGSHERRVRLRLENVNLGEGRLDLSPGAREVSRRGATVDIEAALRDGPLVVGLSIPTATAVARRFAVFGCSRSNRLIGPILDDLARERALFVVHLGDLGHGLAYETEVMRAAFDDLGLPFFVTPGNHDVSPIPANSLRNFHRYLNPAPFAFGAAGQRFAFLDVSDYPIATAQLDWLEQEVAAAGERRVWIFLHRSPVDPENAGRELPASAGGARLASIVAKAKDARVYAAHLDGYAASTFGGHPFFLSAGGGEAKADGVSPYHHLRVPLDGRDPEVVRYAAPSWIAASASRLRFETPALLGHPWFGAGVALVALAVLRLAQRTSGRA